MALMTTRVPSYGQHASEATRMNRSAYEQRLMNRKTTNLVQSVLLLGGMTLLLALLLRIDTLWP